MEILKQFAESGTTETHQEGLLTVLGIDWMMLVFQVVAFLLLLALLGKFVYPWLMKAVDERQEKIEASVKAAGESQAAAQEAEEKVQKLLKEARVEANGIIAIAKSESASIIGSAEKKSKKLADQITAAAHEQIEKDIIAAKNDLKKEMLELVSLATEKVVGASVMGGIDAKIIEKTIKEIE